MFYKAFEQMWKDWSETYYTMFIALICQIFALITGLVFFKKEFSRIVFIIFVSATILSFVSDYYFKLIKVTGINTMRYTVLRETKEIIFGMVEFAAFYTYFFQLFWNQRIIRWLIFFSCSLSIFIFNFFTIHDKFASKRELFHASFLFSSFEMLFLAIPSLVYFIKILQSESQEPLNQKPSFWIVMGLLLYSTLIIPFFLLTEQIPVGSTLDIFGFSLHLLLFSLLFLFLAKAFSLKKPLTD